MVFPSSQNLTVLRLPLHDFRDAHPVKTGSSNSWRDVPRHITKRHYSTVVSIVPWKGEQRSGGGG